MPAEGGRAWGAGECGESRAPALRRDTSAALLEGLEQSKLGQREGLGSGRSSGGSGPLGSFWAQAWLDQCRRGPLKMGLDTSASLLNMEMCPS